MSEQRFTTNKAPTVTIQEAHRDVVIKGWSELEVMIEGSQVEAQESEKGILITGYADMVIRVPKGAFVSVLRSHRDLAVKGVEGDLVIGEADRDVVVRQVGNVEIGHVHHDLVVRSAEGVVQINEVNGDLSLRSVRDVSLGTVHGDVSGRDLDGHLTVKEIMGDLALRDVSGNVNLGVIYRDTSLKAIEGLVNLAQGMGDIRLMGPLAEGKHELHCQRDLVLRWPTNAPLMLTATAPQVRNRLPLEEVVEGDGMLSGHIGKGGPAVTLSAEGRVILKPAEMVDEKWFNFAFDDGEFDLDMAGLGEKISSEVNKRMTDVRQRMAQMSADMDERIGTEFSSRFDAQAGRWAERAERMAEKALQQAEKALKQTRQKTTAAAPSPSPAPAASKTPISPEEKLKILKMLEKGVISVEEANSLLTALEG
ncbi:MAG: hypothetical protein IPL78_22085 [Chloroflexi bacterium]|nr:hypothetical protein [Chloroflexota bacterium]